jgi:hypothetical protein
MVYSISEREGVKLPPACGRPTLAYYPVAKVAESPENDRPELVQRCVETV